MADESTFTLRLGTNSVTGLGTYSRRMAIGSTASATLSLPIAALVNASADYSADAAILEISAGEQFLGLVEAARITNDRVTIELRNGQELTDTRLGGVGFVAIDPREIVWSLARTAGLPAAKIAIPGWTPGPEELFEVVAPLRGLQVDGRLDVADILITAEPHVSRSAESIGPDPLRAVFQEAPCWAVAQVSAPTVFDAEVAGLATIDLALGWLMSRSHFAGAALPAGEPVTYSRRNALARIDRTAAVYARGLITGRKWLRSPANFDPDHVLNLASIDLFELPRLFPLLLTPQEREAIAAWRRSVEAPDPMARVSAISEAIEFLSAGVKPVGTPLFDRAARRHLLRLVRSEFSGTKLARLQELCGWLNEPSLSLKLDLWLEREGVALTPSDRDVLDRVRQIRNDFVHGRTRDLPTAGDLRYASSVVNRLIVRRVHNLSALRIQPTEVS